MVPNSVSPSPARIGLSWIKLPRRATYTLSIKYCRYYLIRIFLFIISVIFISVTAKIVLKDTMDAWVKIEHVLAYKTMYVKVMFLLVRFINRARRKRVSNYYFMLVSLAEPTNIGMQVLYSFFTLTPGVSRTQNSKSWVFKYHIFYGIRLKQNRDNTNSLS